MDNEEFKPISPLGYIGYEILFGLPGIGFIICIILAIVAKNKNVKNFALAQIIMAIVIAVVTFVVALVSGLSMSDLTSQLSEAANS